MARITIEDCIEKVPNRFHLVQMTAIRAKQLKRGAQSLVGGDDNKEVVTALREIAAGHVSPDDEAPVEPGAETAPAAVVEEKPVAAAAPDAPAAEVVETSEPAPAEEPPPTEG